MDKISLPVCMTIRFSAGFNCEQYLGSGWTNPDEKGVYNNAQQSVIRLPHPLALANWSLKFSLFPLMSERVPIGAVRISIDGQIVGSLLVSSRLTYEAYVADFALLNSDTVLIAFECIDVMQTDASANALSYFRIGLEALDLKMVSQSRSCVQIYTPSLEHTTTDTLQIKKYFDDDVKLLHQSLEPFSPLTVAIQSFINGVGASSGCRRYFWNQIEERIRCHTGVKIDSNKPWFDMERMHNVVAEYAPFLREIMFDYVDNVDDARVSEVLLPGGANEAWRPNTPVPFPSALELKERPAILLFAAHNADAYLHPFHTLVFDRDTKKSWLDANLQRLSKSILLAPTLEVSGSIVILQDLFDCSNFSHFLLDAITRLYHFCFAKPHLAANAIFVFGGTQTALHNLVLSVLLEDLNIGPEQVLFPVDATIVRPDRGVYWFSDQARNLHPGQMMHPQSVAALRRIGARLKADNESTGNLYISRSDATSRRLENEVEVWGFLEKKNFRRICLSEYPILEQIRLVANATCVVAPHGMGLTHLAFHQGKPKVVECFNPTVASSAYAFLSLAYGFDYHCIIGEECDAQTRDFKIKLEDLSAALSVFSDFLQSGL